jgi:hypothetical protein
MTDQIARLNRDGLLAWTLLVVDEAEKAAALTEAESVELITAHRDALAAWFAEGHGPYVAGLALALVAFDGYAQSAILDALAIIGSGGVVCRLPQVAAA